ncbi:hypothetical protein DXV75_03260 [Alteromonas aestuariivivens]|uniref:Uncharacterized protein n=1 Tax=Alteromonas aestuariivivens TaxID=1938339 RepID=A0A3D8MC79_9ALTE|nr:hypothetical protein [Alteromonas aestuariivivens]RDV28001.1 hypothetical protein DXV75_03260 [Alteromonas aestuariivivens]
MKVIRIVLGISLSLLILSAITLVLVLDRAPLVVTQASDQVDQADSVNRLIPQLERSLKQRHQSQRITITQAQFDGLVGFIQRASPNFRGRVNVTPVGSTFAASVMVSLFGIERYVNVEALLLPDERLNIDYLKIGSIRLPGWMAVMLVEKSVNWWTQSDIATTARTHVTRLVMEEGRMVIHHRPMEGFLRQLNKVKYGIGVEQDEQLRELTAYYLRYVAWQDITLNKEPQPFFEFLRIAMKRAQQRSTEADAALHNEAAILALAIFIGHHRIANFVGDVQPDADHALKPAAPALLRERNDLARHFIISAALKLLSEQGVSMAIGEFKELMDRAMGGSGYSFVDLTADMAGIEFARVATEPYLAAEVQAMVVNAEDESVFMPPIDNLPEGLSKAEFEAEYQKVDSERYLSEVKKVRARLDALPLYQLGKMND